jgi:hypothetical protein
MKHPSIYAVFNPFRIKGREFELFVFSHTVTRQV